MRHRGVAVGFSMLLFSGAGVGAAVAQEGPTPTPTPDVAEPVLSVTPVDGADLSISRDRVVEATVEVTGSVPAGSVVMISYPSTALTASARDETGGTVDPSRGPEQLIVWEPSSPGASAALELAFRVRDDFAPTTAAELDLEPTTIRLEVDGSPAGEASLDLQVAEPLLTLRTTLTADGLPLESIGGVTSVAAGQMITQRWTVANVGTAPSGSVALRIAYGHPTVLLVGDDAPTPEGDGRVPFTLEEILPGGSDAVVIATQIDPVLFGDHDNVVLSAEIDGQPPRPARTLDIGTSEIKTAVSSTGTVAPGETVRLTITVRNEGRVASPQLTVRSVTTAGSEFVAAVDVQGDGAEVEDAVEWSIPTLDVENGESQVDLALDVTVKDDIAAADAAMDFTVTVPTAGTTRLVETITIETPEAVADPASADEKVEFPASIVLAMILGGVGLSIGSILVVAWLVNCKQGKLTSAFLPTYIEAVLVMVLVVAILVLNLAGGLSGESAGPLIGSIAGYVLGRNLPSLAGAASAALQPTPVPPAAPPTGPAASPEATDGDDTSDIGDVTSDDIGDFASDDTGDIGDIGDIGDEASEEG